MRRHLRPGSRTSWIVAWMLAAAAPVVYLARPADGTWWIGLLLVVPLVGLTAWRQDRQGSPDQDVAAADGGPWGPPDHGGGL
jgi:hypothetical protein